MTALKTIEIIIRTNCMVSSKRQLCKLAKKIVYDTIFEEIRENACTPYTGWWKEKAKRSGLMSHSPTNYISVYLIWVRETFLFLRHTAHSVICHVIWFYTSRRQFHQTIKVRLPHSSHCLNIHKRNLLTCFTTSSGGTALINNNNFHIQSTKTETPPLW